MCCKANSVIKAAELVDHIVPHKGDQRFWDPANWQSLCDRCHKTIKQALEQVFAAGRLDGELLDLARPFPEVFGGM